MEVKKILKAIAKGVVTASCITAINQVIGYHANPYKSSTSTGLLCDIAGASIGFVLGKIVSDEVIETVENYILKERDYG